jgi:hypothetical protein
MMVAGPRSGFALEYYLNRTAGGEARRRLLRQRCPAGESDGPLVRGQLAGCRRSAVSLVLSCALS